MTERLVVIGGDAAGMSAASQARRRRDASDLEIIAVEKSSWVSYSACGEPYHVAGLVDPLEALVARTPEQFAARDIDVRIRTEAIHIDLDRRHVLVRDHRREESSSIGFDQLLVATGTRAVPPRFEGAELAGVHTLRTLDDAAVLRAVAEGRRGRVVVVGGGYIGLEAAEAFIEQGWDVSVVTSGSSVLTATLDATMGDLVTQGMADMGIDVITDQRIECLSGRNGRVVEVGCDSVTLPADVVLLALGSEPVIELAKDAGIPIGDSGAIAVDDRQRTSIDGIWSAGDCAEVFHRISERPVNIHLGTVANKTGRVAGINLGGDDARFPGALRTVITRVGATEVAATGLRRDEAIACGLDPVEATATGTTIAGYMPSAEPMAIRVVAERSTTRLLGAQIVGGAGAGKRVDVFATALWNGMTASDLAWTDLAYAPPFSGTWDLIHIAARDAARAAARDAAGPAVS